MLEQILMEIHNWFRVRDGLDGIHPGTYTIEGGGIVLPFLAPSQYFRIMGSVFNDGLHRYGPDMEALTDETLGSGPTRHPLSKALVELAGEVEAWQKKYGERAASMYSSESLAGQYSYTMDTESSSWQAAFRARLDPYRKLREI